MLPCPVKSFTGLDCPGCGIQRSFLLLVKGDVAASFWQYPPLFSILLMFVLLAIHLKVKSRTTFTLLISSVYLSLAFILCNYAYKVIFHKLH